MVPDDCIETPLYSNEKAAEFLTLSPFIVINWMFSFNSLMNAICLLPVVLTEHRSIYGFNFHTCIKFHVLSPHW